MTKLEKDIERLGGLASMGELLYLGHWRELIEIALRYRSLVRVRRGWYALPGEPESVMRAWRVGGRLACVSAVAYWRGNRPTAELHIEVPANAAHLRNPDDPQRKLSPADAVVVHWARHPQGGDSRAVSLRHAEEQSLRCKGHK